MAETKRDTKGDEKLLTQARADYDRAYERERHNIKMAYADLEFLAGDDYAQWPSDQRKSREAEGRPVLQINRLPQFVHQITGDIRQMKPAIKVVPVDSGADEKRADLYGGLIRYVENRSDASAIYFRAADSQVACGIGHWRVLSEYADSSTFNQELRIGPIEDGVAVLWDPDAVLPTKEDAQYCFVPVDMNKTAFEDKYPGVTASEFDDPKWEHNSEWTTDDYVRVTEYWVKKPTKKTLALGLDGSIADVTDAPPEIIAYQQAKGARVEQRDSTKVCRYLITSGSVLEGPEEWKGRHIPIIPLIGEEVRIGRKIIRKGIVRDAIDPQRMVNYFESMHTETVALQPKAPFLVTEANVAKYQSVWETANTKNLPYLPYEPDKLNGGAAPQRVGPPVSSQGILDGLTMAAENLKGVIGIYDAGLGAKSNETSGKAIIARQREGDVGSFHFIDNFARAVRHTGNIIVDLIPHIYDTERTIRIMGEDGKVDVLEVNRATGVDPNTQETIYDRDLTVGSYDVVATVGASYTTRREEAKEGMLQFLQAAPEAGSLVLDLLAKAQDWPNADDFAKRFRASLPPHIVKMEEMEKQGATPEQIQQFLDEARQASQPPDPKLVKVEQDGAIAQAKMAAEQEQFMANLQLQQQQMQIEAQKQAEESRQAQNEFMANMQKMFLDSQTKIEIAQINAGVGMHKNIVQAGVDEMKTQTSAAIESTKIESAAEIARYQTDNRPEPKGASA